MVCPLATKGWAARTDAGRRTHKGPPPSPPKADCGTTAVQQPQTTTANKTKMIKMILLYKK